MTEYTHTCCVCGHVWEQPPKDWKKTRTAVTVNKDGPYCEGCRTGIEFLRIARVRKKAPIVWLNDLAERELLNEYEFKYEQATTRSATIDTTDSQAAD